jgi:hypothetical protein
MEKRDPPWCIVDSTVAGAMIDRTIVFRELGNPHLVNESGDGEAGPCDYWCYEFSCGLVVLATSHRQGYFDLRSNSFEPAHALSHFPWVSDYSPHLSQIDNVYKPAIPDWFIPKQYKLFRIDDLGNRFEIRDNVPEYESRCALLAFERNTHHQGYFREPA